MAEQCAKLLPSVEGEPHRCRYRGRIERGGKWYCRVHARTFDKSDRLERLQALNAELVAALEGMMKGNERPLDGETAWQRVVMPSDYACDMAYTALKKAQSQ